MEKMNMWIITSQIDYNNVYQCISMKCAANCKK